MLAGGGSGLPSSVVPVEDFSVFTPSSTQPLPEKAFVSVRTTSDRGDFVAPQPVLRLPPGWMSLDRQGRAVMDWTRRMPDPPKPPPPPVREVGPLEAAKRGVLSGAGTGMLPLVAASDAMFPPTWRTPLQVARLQHGLPAGGLQTLTEIAMDNVRQGELKPGEHYSGPLAEGIQAVTHVAGEAPFIAAESAGGPLLRGAAGAHAGYAIRKDQLKRAGLSDEQAGRPAEIAGGISGLFHAVPLGLPGSLAPRVGTGAAAMGALGPASRWLENRSLPEDRPDLRQPVEDTRGAAYDLVSGGLLNGALGSRQRSMPQGLDERPAPRMLPRVAPVDQTGWAHLPGDVPEERDIPEQERPRAKPIPPVLKSGHLIQHAGQKIIQWGKGHEDAEALSRNMTVEKSREILRQIPAEDINAIRAWYNDFAAYLHGTNPEALQATPTPIKRAELMGRILELGKQDDPTKQ